MSCNRAQIFRRAHETARWRVLSVGKSVKPYRAWFAEALRAEYKKLHQAKLREEQNRNGLPIASCAADRPAYRHTYHPAAYIGSREGAIAALGSRVAASFIAARADGRRAAHSI
ncbi:MAG: hypothetical protein EKK29_17195 [Hyphomicrobiales bacterium]|nr:MAG: hypothetical protein EKK29_17195 [Hyphomicrobiales bacterium]